MLDSLDWVTEGDSLPNSAEIGSWNIELQRTKLARVCSKRWECRHPSYDDRDCPHLSHSLGIAVAHQSHPRHQPYQ